MGIGAAEKCAKKVRGPLVTLATAHPAKFPDAVETAVGVRHHLPDRLADLHDLDERMVTIENDLEAVQEHIRTVIP
ncbi:MAG: hypothetical protein ACFB6S_07525 [Geminicoccaceae bacterium]